ncbi:M23 family metallopeptidase [Flavobacterium suncheonense]|uniref:M23 family metallopeptidase n=1 Tax=Flavobacterium suncheonense TaxID=350894 RepID=UPI0006848646|nr:M23 family metallopeptidase [Flavobacterium suncheonense]
MSNELSKYKKPLAIIGIATILYFMASTKSFAKITVDNVKRGCDQDWGCGSYGATRGNRTHNGLDIKAIPGQQIISPISGTVTRFPYPYGDDLRWTGIEIKNSDYHVKIFYLTPTVLQNAKVKQGQVIGRAQNIASKYSSSMTNHVHIEVRNAKTLELINPDTLL